MPLLVVNYILCVDLPFGVKDLLTTLNQVSLKNSFFVDLYLKEILFSAD